MPGMVSSSLKAQATKLVMQRLLMAFVREELCASTTRLAGAILLEKERLRLPVSRFYSMGRFDLADWPCCEDEKKAISSLKELAFRLHGGLEQEVLGRLIGELENSRDNLSEALRAQDILGIGQVGEGSLADWEGRVWEGHPLHPGNRLRTGISKKAQVSYGPEWQTKFPLSFLRLPKDDLSVEGDFGEQLYALYPRLKALAGSEDYAIVPVHPWAAASDLPQRFNEQFASGRFQWVDFKEALVRPTMSFRTLILYPKGHEADLHLKLPVAVQTTGAVRTVSVAATKNGPVMSAFLKKLWGVRQCCLDDKLKDLLLMEETASFSFADNSSDQARFLSGILRKAPSCSTTVWRLPAAALLEPASEPLFLRTANLGSMQPLELWQRYCQALIPPIAFLCGRLGIALEAHPQNIVVQFEKDPGGSWLVKFLYRDLGGIRMHPQKLKAGLDELKLAANLNAPQFYPGSATTTSSLRELSSKFIYSLLQNHLGELVRSIVRVTAEPETSYWACVLEVLKRCASSLGADLSQRVFADFWDFKSMWRMRIDSKVTEYTFAPVKSPLILKDNI